MPFWYALKRNSMQPDILKVIAIDNDNQFQETYSYFFENYLDYDLVATYSNIEDALLHYDDVRPDIILSEVILEEANGIDAIQQFRKKDEDVKIIMISEQSEFDLIKKAFKMGANGYMTKPVSERRLYHALNSVKYDGAMMSSDIIKKVISDFHKKSYQFFSERENQIVDFLCKGATYKMMAEKLFVTTSTINFHIQNIYLKLNVNSKSEALLKLKEL